MAAEASAGPATSRRRFRLLDAMILVAATAMGLGVVEWVSCASDGELSWPAALEDWRSIEQSAADGSGINLEAVANWGFILALLTLPLAVSWTAALTFIRLLGPRPSLSRVARQPGFAATGAATLALLFAGLQGIGVALTFGWQAALELIIVQGSFLLVMTSPGPAVAAAWLMLAVTRRWKAERSWIDRLGRAVGVCWLVAAFVGAGVSVARSPAPICRFVVRNVSPNPNPGPGPEDAGSLNTYAWWWATSSDAQKRDGRRALEAATRACELTEWQNPAMLDTLAAANAEVGDFVAAVLWQREALDRISDGMRDRPGYEDRLRMYERREPYRDDSDLEGTKIRCTLTPLP